MENKKLPQSFVFNLGRVWQSALGGDWAEAERICALIEETGAANGGLKRLRKAVVREDFDGVDGSLEKILGW